MPPKQQQQPQNQPQQKPPPSGKCSGSKPPGGDGSGKPAGQMNYFAALAGIADADALKDEIAVEEEQRRAASSSNGAAAAANGRRSRNVDGEGGGMKQPLIWIDLEMTGLDVESDQILQIAVICTDGAMEEVVEGPELAIHQPEEVLQTMNEWCVEQHGKSGLTQIAGNSVHVDLAFMRKHMPRLVDHLSYRIVDVSTVGELCRRWFPREHMRAPKKKNTHTALSDIRESITQLLYYRRSIFKKWSGANLP